MDNLSPNFHRVAPGVYIVRTQAGFRKALKKFLGESYAEMKSDLVGYPKEYPSMVFFSNGYKGYFFPVAKCIPLHTVRGALSVADPAGESSPPVQPIQS
jgi:hypothetical protein